MSQAIYNCIIIDDEPKAIELLSDAITDLYPNLHISATFTSWKDALPALRLGGMDILFLDISMPQKTGIDMLALVPELDCEIIFVTAHSEYALNAFDVGATGYIVKPIRDAMLTKVIDKALEHIKNKIKAQVGPGHEALKHKIGIPNTRGIDYVDIDNILFIEALKRYTRIVDTQREIQSSYNIGKYKQLINSNMFYQVHRSFIVNINYVMRYETTGIITMTNGASIPVSKNVREDFLRQFEHINK